MAIVERCRRRLEESRRMRLASLEMRPDEPHLDNTYEPWKAIGEVNAISRFALGLLHDDDHLDQIAEHEPAHMDPQFPAGAGGGGVRPRAGQARRVSQDRLSGLLRRGGSESHLHHLVLIALMLLPAALDTVMASAVTDRVRAFSVRHIVLTGGDPLLRGDIVRLIHHAWVQGLEVAVSTTGDRLTDDFLAATAGYIDLISPQPDSG